MKTTSSNRSTEKEEERERKRHGEHCIAKRIAENRQANSEKGKQGLEGVEGLAGRFAVCLDLNTWSRVVHMHVVYSQKKRERGRERKRKQKKGERRASVGSDRGREIEKG